MVDYSSHIKNHPLHRPLNKFFDDKKEMRKEAEIEALEERKGKEKELSVWIKEISKLKIIIDEYRNKIFVCFTCKRKFSSFDLLKRHEIDSEFHKQSLKQSAEDLENPAPISQDYEIPQPTPMQIFFSEPSNNGLFA